MKKIKFIIERTTTGYSAYCETYPIYTTGRTILELQRNALEASNLFLEDLKRKTTQKNLEFEIDFKQFFEYYKVINSKHLAKRIGMNETLLSQYVNGIKKPSKNQINRIVEGLNDIGKELMELSLV